MILQFFKGKRIQLFGLPRTIFSDNTTAFMYGAVQNYLKDIGLIRRPVLAYAPMSNGTVQRMLAPFKQSIFPTNMRRNQVLG